MRCTGYFDVDQIEECEQYLFVQIKYQIKAQRGVWSMKNYSIIRSKYGNARNTRNDTNLGSKTKMQALNHYDLFIAQE